MKIKTRTVTLKARKSEKPTKYPVPYIVWRKLVKGRLSGGITWTQAQEVLKREEITAIPLRGTKGGGRLSPWLTVSKSVLKYCKKAIAPENYVPYYVAREGFLTGGLNAAFFLDILDELPNGCLLVRNRGDDGKIKCQTFTVEIEADLVHPMIRGKNVAKWRCVPGGHSLITQDPSTKIGFPEKWMQRHYPLIWDYLLRFKPQLLERKAIVKAFENKRAPFYSMYGLANYTFAPYKVVWMDISSTMKAAVVVAEEGKVPLPEHTVMMVEVESEDEAHYLAAVLNSKLVGSLISGYIVDNHLSTHPLENIVVHPYEAAKSEHQKLRELSVQAHEAASRGDVAILSKLERQMDRLVRGLYE